MTKEQKFQKPYARELLRIAKADLEAAEILAKGNVSRKEIIFFQIEQAIEKSLKAYLCHLGIAVPLTHDLNIILDRFPPAYPIPHGDNLDDLIQFATIRRYEEGSAVFTSVEVDTAIAAAKDIIGAVEKAVG